MTTTNTTTLDDDVRQIVDQIRPILEHPGKGHALAPYALGTNVNELDTSHDECAINKLEPAPRSKQVVIAAVREANRRCKDSDASLEVAESAATTAREVACNHRVELGRALIEARKLFPTSGSKAKGWGDLLKSEGLPRQTALDYMKLAGYFDEIPTPRRGNLSLRNAGIKKDKKPRSLADHLTTVLADLETRLIEATTEEQKALVDTLANWLEAYR